MENKQAKKRIAEAFAILMVYGWTVEQRHRLVEGLYRDDAVEAAEKAVIDTLREKGTK